MAQMAPALAEAAGSPSPNSHISSSVQSPLREPYVEGETVQKSRLHVNCTLNHNGICRSLPNSINTKSTSKPVLRCMDEVHELNNFPHSFRKGSDLAMSVNSHCPNTLQGSSVEKTNAREQIQSVSSQKETLFSTPTRIQIITTKTCGSKSLENRSSCEASNDKTNEKSNPRHVPPCPAPPRVLLDAKVKKIGLNQTRLFARARKLERRLRTLQSRQLESHVSEQLGSLALSRKKSQTSQLGYLNRRLEQPKQDVIFRPSVSHVKAENETPLKSVDRVREELTSNDLSGQTKRSSQDENDLRTNVRRPSVKESEENASRSLVCQLELAEHVGDSDATESSSGGESCDEMDYSAGNGDSKIKGLSGHLNQFYSDRRSIASKWTWLRSQVIDIERRIRRCEETYKAVRLRKAPVQLERQKHVVNNGNILSVATKKLDEPLPNSEDEVNNRKISGPVAAALSPGKEFPHNFNSLMLSMKEKANLLRNIQNCSLENDADHIISCTASRTRSVQQWQPRKLFHLSEVQKSGHSMICMCATSWTPCILCSRSSPSLPKLLPRQDLRERVSLVDLSFHPVLSFETEIPLSLHFGALLKKGNFQSKIFKLNPPKDVKNASKRKYIRSTSSPASMKKERKEALELSYKKEGIRSLRDHKNRKNASNSSKKERALRQKSNRAHAKRSAAVSAGLRLASQLQKRARSLSLPSGSSRPSSPVSNNPSPTSLTHSLSSNSLSAKRKKPTSNAFDINNIVIPYSMASTTRVEKLQYKEILTPAWREMTFTPQDQTIEGKEEEEMEDLSNLSFALRHLKCEENERKRFVGLAIKKKKRPTRQNSEATTPEPVSPGSLLFDGNLTAGQTSSGVPSPTSSNPSLNSSLNVTSPTGLPSAVVNMMSSEPLPIKVERAGKSARQGSRRSSSVDYNEDSNDTWPVVVPWPLRNFPLSEAEVENLNNPPPTPRGSMSVPPSPSSSRTESPLLSPVDSPDSSAGANWTVKLLSPEEANNAEADSKPPRKGIVLKLAKR